MKKTIIVFVIVLGAGIAYWLISPAFIDREVQEELGDITVPAEEESLEIIRSGVFEGLLGHSAKGTAQLIKVGDSYYLRLEEDFEVTNGPDLFVHFGHNGEYAKEARIGALKGNKGSQNYEVPASIDPLLYNEVWVWCRSFSVPFGKAILTGGS